ncbi:YhdT family protein [Bacillus sp. S/N-304-OC-R1]|uniref:YhdT family protein n=1 Tax=Bacillus sp. S/N-304-OC-R1 TaxID=2758034 RepID=UPI001C8D5208|nr:YhdT family protein [Bacillus sp. S/N-304-OC-R1]MBY0122977.1 YhdT family protein [Bacillus sp. S/N-304-OC-R1]
MEKQSHKKDPRFKIAEREAWIGIGLVVFNFIWWFGFAYGMGSGPVEKYEFIFGLPAWFFYSCVAGIIIMVILVIIVVKFFFKDVSFEEEEERGASK